MRIQTRALVEGAIFAAITVVMGLLSFYIPFFVIISIMWPVPTILIAFRHGLKTSIISALTAAVLVAILTEPVQGLGFFIGFGVPGIVMGYLLKKKMDPMSTIMISGIVFFICLLGNFLLPMLVTGTDIFKTFDQMIIEMKNSYRATADSMAGMYGSAGLSPEELEKQIDSYEKMLDTMKLVIPGALLFVSVVFSFINFKVSRLILSRINNIIEDVTPFSLWRLPNNATVLVSTLLFLCIIEINLLQIPQFINLSLNVFLLVQYILIILGLSLVKYILDRYSMHKALKALIMILALYPFGQVLMFAGLIDMVVDIRKLLDKFNQGT